MKFSFSFFLYHIQSLAGGVYFVVLSDIINPLSNQPMLGNNS